MEQIQIIKPDDMHLHLRDGSAMRSVLLAGAINLHGTICKTDV